MREEERERARERAGEKDGARERERAKNGRESGFTILKGKECGGCGQLEYRHSPAKWKSRCEPARVVGRRKAEGGNRRKRRAGGAW